MLRPTTLFLSLFSLFSKVDAALVSRDAPECPISTCAGEDVDVDSLNKPNYSNPLAFFQNPSKALSYSVEARQLKNVHRTTKSGFSIYNVQFKPAHFSCMSCDVGTCDKCNVVCDLSKCMGEFYEQECWCRKESHVKLKTPLWRVRKTDGAFLTDRTVHKFFCDKNCKGSVCDTDGLQCKTREEACKPWWWCGLKPPKTSEMLNPTDGWPDGMQANDMPSFLQTESKAQVATAAKVEAQVEMATEAKTETGVSRKFEANDKKLFNFGQGRWVCEDAALPPKIQDATTYLWKDRGYIVFPKKACQGGAFNQKCMCWDDNRRLKGLDPLTSEATCDSSCTFGGCEGRTCGTGGPPPLPPKPAEPPMNPMAAEALKAGELQKPGEGMEAN